MKTNFDTKSVVAAVGLFALAVYQLTVSDYANAIASVTSGLAVLGLTYRQTADHNENLLKTPTRP